MHIVAGYGCPLLHLGQSRTEIRKTFGRPDQLIRRFSDSYFYVYRHLGIDIDFGSREGDAEALFFYREGESGHRQADIELEGGIGFHSSRSDVIRVFGKQDKGDEIPASRRSPRRAWIWYRDGTQFKFDAEGTITVISIEKPAAE